MAGCPAKATDRLHAVMDRCSGKLSFHLMFSIEGHPVPVSVWLIQTERHDSLKLNLCFSMIFHADGSCDNIQFFDHTIIQFYSDILYIITKCDHQSFCLVFVCIHCRKSRNGIFSLDDLIAFITKPQSSCSIIIADIECTLAIISTSKGRIFLWQSICRIGSVISCFFRISGKTMVSSLDQIRIIKNLCFLSVIGVKQNSLIICLHLIHTVSGTQSEQSVFFFKYNCHSFSPLDKL